RSGMAVVDRIKIYAGMGAFVVRSQAAPSQREALNQVRLALPQHVRNLTVSVWPKGQIAVEGSVSTYDDKLAASRFLSRVNGCTCVINQLMVTHEPENMVQAASQSAPSAAHSENSVSTVSQTVTTVAHHSENTTEKTSQPAVM